MARSEHELYPDYTPEIEAIRKQGITESLLTHIIDKHKDNAQYNRNLYNRYMTLEGEVPIFNREPRFTIKAVNGKAPKQINNKINNEHYNHRSINPWFNYIAEIHCPVAYNSNTQNRYNFCKKCGNIVKKI